MTGARLAVVALVVVAVVVGRIAYRRWKRAVAADDVDARLPAQLVAGAERTWVVFTTPYCATCGPVVERLRAFDPDARVVKIDATEETELAGEYRIRAAPTVLLAGEGGLVQRRLVGAGAVNDFVDAHTDRSYQA